MTLLTSSINARVLGAMLVAALVAPVIGCGSDRTAVAEDRDASVVTTDPDAGTARGRGADHPDASDEDAPDARPADASQADAGAIDAPDGAAGEVDDEEDIAACGDELASEHTSDGPAGGPAASVVFPSHRAYPDADTIRVRGTANDPDGVAAVSVNGVGASSSDAFATWTATVPIAHGCNVLRVTATDSLGNRNERADALANQGVAQLLERAR